MKRTATAKQVWNWKDDYAVELTGKGLDELESMAALYEGQALPSERTQECALMIRSEMTRREASIEKLLEEVNF